MQDASFSFNLRPDLLRGSHWVTCAHLQANTETEAPSNKGGGSVLVWLEDIALWLRIRGQFPIKFDCTPARPKWRRWVFNALIHFNSDLKCLGRQRETRKTRVCGFVRSKPCPKRSAAPDCNRTNSFASQKVMWKPSNRIGGLESWDTICKKPASQQPLSHQACSVAWLSMNMQDIHQCIDSSCLKPYQLKCKATACRLSEFISFRYSKSM